MSTLQGYKLFLERRKKKVNGKKAILMGLNYPGTKFRLAGCVNDVRNGKKFLNKKGYDTKVLIDKDIKRDYDLLEALEELKNSDAKTIFFHYSGHGTRIRDRTRDELDGWDEVVFSKNGRGISDDQIVEKLQSIKNKTIYLIFDCCHSGSIADLPFRLSPNTRNIKENDYQFESDIICISGCKDVQTSADVTENNVSFGALSKTLYDLLRRKKGKYTWKELWLELLKKMREKGYSQVPQLSVSDVNLFEKIVQL